MADPLISLHSVTESDNNAMEAVASVCAALADRTNTSFAVAHHVRKTGGNEVTIEDARGATALINASRISVVLNPMSEKEAAEAKVTNRTSYFRTGPGKENLAKSMDQQRWFRFASVDLGNADGVQSSDLVGVVEAWDMPSKLAELTQEHLRQVQARLDDHGPRRLSDKAEDWIGYDVAEILCIDIGRYVERASDRTKEQQAARKQVLAAINAWILNGSLERFEEKDAHRVTKEFVRSGIPAERARDTP
jgi:hypothetical protein